MAAPSPSPQGAIAATSCRLTATGFDALAGFAEDDHLAAWTVFMRSARVIVDAGEALRTALPPDPALRRLCGLALIRPRPQTGVEARGAFETLFTPHRIEAEPPGFLTGYYEPEVDGALERSAAFAAPILRRPADLGRIGPGVAPTPYLDRAAIEARAEAGGGDDAVVWLRDWTEVFFIHVQGSARVRLPDGRRMRLVYDGRNGQPYTSIGRRLIETGEIAPAAMSLDRVKGWLRSRGQDVGAQGRTLMRSNRSYIFFRAEPDVAGEGPIGGAGHPLSASRSIAVDRTLWPYGLPFFLEADLPAHGGALAPFRRLMIAQDTGSAILGPARADLFLGSGEEAGRRAGDIRHAAAFTVLLPRDGL